MAPITRRKQAEIEANSSAVEGSSPAPKDAAAKRGRKLALRGREGESDGSPKAAAKTSTVIVFDDEEMSKPVAAKDTAAQPVAPAEDDEEEDEEDDESDDEAPEAVSTTKAASEIKSAAKATQKAAQEQATAQKRKRQERDALLKKQAEERKKLEDAQSSPAADEAKSLVAPRPSASRRRGGQVELPTLLPAEFLTDSSGESDNDDDAGARGAARRPNLKRRKVAVVERSLTRLDKGPQDATIGSTVYQVAKKTDGRMAPKVKQYSKSTKELLLRRNRVPAKPRGGFFAKR
ncbi:hypothetical protein V2A60_005063 [Cordyceps javanica]